MSELNEMKDMRHGGAVRRIVAVGFSPCGGTADRLRRLAGRLAGRLGVPVAYHWYTLPGGRVPLPPASADTLLVWASPVYAGRLPNKLAPYVAANLRGEGCPFVGLVTFGNRSAGDALSELVGLARSGGCRPVGAAAVAVRHVFSTAVGTGRPTATDDAELDAFADRLADSLEQGGAGVLPTVGNEAPTEYYQPLRDDGTPARFLKALPTADAARCNGCGTCAAVCPMGIVAMHDGLPRFEGACIKCQACLRACPQGALRIADADFNSHVLMLEHNYAAPAPNLFLTA